MKTKDRTKEIIIAEKLVNSGIHPDEAEYLAGFCLGLAYQKTTSTKFSSYVDFETKHGKTKRFEVYKYLKAVDLPLSRQDISDFTGEKLSTICARIHELKQDGLVVVVGTKRDPETNKKVQLLTTADLTLNQGVA